MKNLNNAFVKYHGNGNDFIIVDKTFLSKAFGIDWFLHHAQELCHRNRGIGADGIIILDLVSGIFTMTVINADGSIAKTCGNGLRCGADYLFAHHQVNHKLEIALSDRVYLCEKTNDGIRVGMGECSIGKEESLYLESLGESLSMARVSMANEHVIVFFEHPMVNRDIYLRAIRSSIDKADNFNIGFLVKDGSQFFSYVYERGVGWTLSCGSGACAAALFLAQRYPELADDHVVISQPGGRILVTSNALSLGQDRSVFNVSQTGEARLSFCGYLPSEF